MDKNRPSSGDSNRYVDRIDVVCESLHLFDVSRHLHPNTKQFSFRRGEYRSRLDYWLASEHLMDSNLHSSMSPRPLSDHASIYIKIGSTLVSRGPGLWRLNNALLLREYYVALIKETIAKAGGDNGLSNPNSKWEWIKYQIKLASIKFTRDLQAKNATHEKLLRDRYLLLNNSVDREVEADLDELRIVEREIKDIELRKAKIAMPRS